MNESTVTTRWKTVLNSLELPRWAYTPGRRVAFVCVESWAALVAQVVAVLAKVDLYANVLIQITALSTAAFLVNRVLRKPEEERAQEQLERDILVLESLKLSARSTEKEKVRRYRSYLADVQQARNGDRELPHEDSPVAS